MQTTVFNVQGMTDTNSAVSLKDAIFSITGVSNVSVDTESSKIMVTFDPSNTDLSQIKSTITNNGYNIH